MTWTATELDTLITVGRVDRQPVRTPRRCCVEFRAGDTRYWILVDPDAPVPQTWEEAEALTAGNSVCLDPYPPRSWRITAVVERNPHQEAI